MEMRIKEFSAIEKLETAHKTDMCIYVKHTESRPALNTIFNLAKGSQNYPNIKHSL